MAQRCRLSASNRNVGWPTIDGCRGFCAARGGVFELGLWGPGVRAVYAVAGL